MMQTEKKELESLADIKILVDTFYTKIRKDDLLAAIFDERIQDRWPQHLEKMYSFWQTVLLDEHTYYGAPFLPHATLDVFQQHFDRWLTLWYETLDELFCDGEKAMEAKWRSARMAEMFAYKINQRRINKDLISLI